MLNLLKTWLTTAKTDEAQEDADLPVGARYLKQLTAPHVPRQAKTTLVYYWEGGRKKFGYFHAIGRDNRVIIARIFFPKHRMKRQEIDVAEFIVREIKDVRFRPI